MSVTRPTDGSVITAAAVNAMHEDVRAVVNSVQPGNIDRFALGPQHLPSCIAWEDTTTSPGADVKKITTTTTMVDGVNTRLVAETDADVQNNWTGLHSTNANWILDNGALGYEFPPCKVLVMVQAQIRDINHADPDNQAWLCPVYSIDGTPTYDINLAGMVQAFNFTGAGNIAQMEYAWASYFLIDQTGAGGTWTLDDITVRYAGGTGTAAGYPTSTVISAGMIGIIPFYRDS